MFTTEVEARAVIRHSEFPIAGDGKAKRHEREP